MLWRNHDIAREQRHLSSQLADFLQVVAASAQKVAYGRQHVKEVHLQLGVRVLVVDDLDLWRHFIVFALAVKPEIQIVAEADTGSAALKKVEEHQPDLVVLDISLPDMDGFQVARQIRMLSPKTKIVFLTQTYGQDIVASALSTGALGYVLKSEAARDLLPALEAALLGKRFISAKAAELSPCNGR